MCLLELAVTFSPFYLHIHHGGEKKAQFVILKFRVRFWHVLDVLVYI